MKRRQQILLFIIVLCGCKKPYNPPAINTPGGYLVVEGVIDPAADSTIIKLSRAVGIAAKAVAKPVSGAVVSVESDQHAMYRWR